MILLFWSKNFLNIYMGKTVMQENLEGSIRIVSHHGKHQSNSASSLPINMPTLLNQFRTTEEDFEEVKIDLLYSNVCFNYAYYFS